MDDPLFGTDAAMPAEVGGQLLPPVGSGDGLPVPRRYLAVVALSLGTVLTTVDGTIVNVALPTLARDLHVRPSTAVLVVTIYQLVLMMALLPFSALGERRGNRTVYQYGQVVFIVATLLCFFATSFPTLVVVRALQALGAAAALSVVSGMIRSTYPAARLGRGMSFNTLVAASSASLAPSVGGAILLFAGWPWLFAIVVPFGVLSILIGMRALPDSPRRHDPYDVPGAAMCAATFGLATCGLETIVQGSSRAVSAILIASAGLLGFVFVRRALGQARPVFPVDLLRIRTIALPSFGSLVAYMAVVIVMVTLPFRLQDQYHYTTAAAGAVLAPFALAALVSAPVSGLMSDRIPAGILGAIGMTIATTGLVFLSLLPPSPRSVDLLWRIGLAGLGFGMFFSPNARQVLASAPVDRATAAGALFTTLRGIGQTLGATAAGALIAARLGNSPAPTLIAAGLGLVAGLCSVVVLRPQPRGLPSDDIQAR